VELVAAEGITQTLQMLDKMVVMELLPLEHIQVAAAVAVAQKFMIMFIEIILPLVD
jgi:hypothetical protein